MGVLLVLTCAGRAAEVLPALALLGHVTRVAPMDGAALVETGPADVILVDARRELVNARALCRLLRTTGLTTPLLAVATEGGLAAISFDWGLTDVILESAGPAEIEARLRLATSRVAAANVDGADAGVIRSGDLTIDEHTYSAKLKGSPLDLTFKEFELVKYLAQHPGRVFSRPQLLQEVWGYDYYGGTRTVDVHVRRLRAKLGPEHESLIGTVRHVGYKFTSQALPEPLADNAGDNAGDGVADGVSAPAATLQGR